MTTLAHPVFGGGWESRTPDFAVQRRRFPTSTNPPNLVEGEGFEPSEQVTPLDRLAICCLKPLSHPSVILVSYFCVRKLTNPVSAAHPVFASAEAEYGYRSALSGAG